MQKIKAVLMKELRECAENVSFERSSAAYPRLRCSLKRLGSADPPVYPYVLYIDFIGRREAVDELNELVEKVCTRLNRTICTDTVTLTCSVEGVQEDPDNKEDVKKIYGSFAIRAYYKE